MSTTYTRKDVLRGLAATGTALAVPARARAVPPPRTAKRPRAITMWEFSWLERRWDGAGYEDWDRALDELGERGYDAIRIEAFPHLIAADGKAEYTLRPEWDTQVWGSPALNRVRVLPALYEFLGKCRDRGIKVSLSSWFREDQANTRMTIHSPQRLAEIWNITLEGIDKAGLLDTILFVDLCNEWPGPAWAPFLQPPLDWSKWDDPRSLSYMAAAIAGVRARYPDMPLLFSTDSEKVELYAQKDLHYFDAIEHHLWMVRQNDNEFYKQTGYNYERFSSQGYDNLQQTAAKLYDSKPEYWKSLLPPKINRLAAAARKAGKPLITTECWAIVDYKDWPLLPWGWVKDVCAVGTLAASATGQWAAIATSNFCGPQFVGMWRDIAWHQRLTSAIKAGPLHPSLKSSRLWARL